MAKLDLKQLKADVERRRQERPQGLGPGGRRLTGSMQAIRDNLAEIEALKAQGNTWREIAAGLAAQNVTQGNGDPITGKRLTALIASIKRQERKRRDAAAVKAARTDLASTSAAATDKSKKLALAPELAGREEPLARQTDFPSEEELRRKALEHARSLTKKG